jgi:hypothetical protein
VVSSAPTAQLLFKDPFLASSEDPDCQAGAGNGCEIALTNKTKGIKTKQL